MVCKNVDRLKYGSVENLQALSQEKLILLYANNKSTDQSTKQKIKYLARAYNTEQQLLLMLEPATTLFKVKHSVI